MKKLFVVIALVVGLTTFAQEKRGEGREKLTPEQQSEAILKKMTSELTLDAKQQESVKVLLNEQAKKREAKKGEFKARKEKGEKLSDEEIAKMKKDRIDEELAMKTQLKKILSEDQYKKWSERRKEMGGKLKGKGKRGGKPVESK